MRNRLAHETNAAFAELLMQPQFEAKKTFWSEAFLMMTGKSIENLAKEVEIVDLEKMEF